MYYYEILNTITLEKAQGVAKNYRDMCHSLCWKPWECKCIYKAPII